MAARTHLYRHQAVADAREQGWAGFRTTLDVAGMWRARYEPGDNPADVFAHTYPTLFSHGEVSWRQGATGADDAVRTGVLVCTCPLDYLPVVGEVVLNRDVAQAALIPYDKTHGAYFIVEPHDRERWDAFTARPEGTAPIASTPPEPAAKTKRTRNAGRGDRGPMAAAARVAPTPVTVPDPEPRPAPAPRTKAPRTKAPDGTRPPSAEPTKPGATKRVWEIADGMQGASRAEVVAACLAEGINRNTAGTQYSHWKRVRGGDAL